MANYFVEFDTTPANLITALKAQMLNSTNWSNPSGGSGHVMTATTSHGAQMAVDLADAAVTSRQLQLGIYRTWASGSGTDKLVRYLCWRTLTAGATTDPIHVQLSLGQDHLWLAIEGPRPGEPSPDDATNGSSRQVALISDIVPYFAGEPSGVVCVLGNTTSLTNMGSPLVYVSRNRANTQSWVPSKLATLTIPGGGGNQPWFGTQRNAQADSNTYLWPYVVIEDTAGLRGRLGKIFFAGMLCPALAPFVAVQDFPPSVYQRQVYNAENYVLVLTVKCGQSGTDQRTGLGWTAQTGAAGGVNAGPVIAVPTA